MSFILDALKKSESDRQRQSGPALFEVKVAPPRRGLPPWAIAIALLLSVNLAIVLWMLLRHGTAPAASAAPAPRAATAPAPAAAPPLGSPLAPAVRAPASAPPALQPPLPNNPALSGGAAVSDAASETAGNAADEAPAAAPAAPLFSHVRRGTADGVPLYQEAAAASGAQIPALRLDLHVFAARPQERFVMINMRRLREGESLPEGVRVESITPDGAVLSYQGSRFLLPRD